MSATIERELTVITSEAHVRAAGRHYGAPVVAENGYWVCRAFLPALGEEIVRMAPIREELCA